MSNQLISGVLVVWLAGGVMSGCADTGPADAPGGVAAERPAKVASGPEAIALSTVAAETGLAPDQFNVISSEAVNFSDASLGCPQPGMAYPQVITPGYRVLVESGGQSFDVRVSGNRGRICDTPRSEGTPRPADTA
jgi:hypothetical protein